MHTINLAHRKQTVLQALLLVVILYVWTYELPSTHAQETRQSQSLIHTKKTIFANFAKIFRKSLKSAPTEIDTKNALSDSLLYGMLAGLKGPIPPFSHGKYTVFIHYDTSEDDRAFIAFARESYAHKHPFVRLTSNPKVMVYVVKKEFEKTVLHYRVIINGVWAHDIQNPQFIIDENGIHISVAPLRAMPTLFTPSVYYNRATQMIRFSLYLNTDTAHAVTNTALNTIASTSIMHGPLYIVGDFTGWDPFLIRMTLSPQEPHVYYANVSLPAGSYSYYFQVGNYDILDPKNKNIAPRRTNNLYVNRLYIEEEINHDTGTIELVARTKSRN